MSYVPSKKKTFLKISGSKSDPNRRHLFCILNDVVNYKHFIVPISSIPSGRSYDNTCELFPEDHPWLSHPSYVAYNFIDECHTTTIAKCVEAGEFQKNYDLSDDVFSRVCSGVATSKRTKPKFKIAHRYCSKS